MVDLKFEQLSLHKQPPEVGLVKKLNFRPLICLLFLPPPIPVLLSFSIKKSFRCLPLSSALDPLEGLPLI